METGGYDEEEQLKNDIMVLLRRRTGNLRTLSAATGIPMEWLADYLDDKKELQELPMEQRRMLAHLVLFLSKGMDMVSEDERLRTVIECLRDNYELSYEALAIYAHLEVKDIEAFIKNPCSISYEKKFHLAVSAMFLRFLLKRTFA